MQSNSLPQPAATAHWLLLIAASSVAMLITLTTPNQPGAAQAWFLAPVFWLVFAVPGAVLLHGHTLTGSSNAAGPDALRGTRSIWGALTFGVVLAMLAARVSGSVSPSVWPGAVMFMLLILTGPRRTG